ncbi:MAG: aminoacyl-tRNA hydrolase [Planctomycetaceae bacterium]|nr:aminoacyl-tRNA hydrolase [Planctomycetaceae bacterium]
MKLVVGLGNPGRRYQGTRHNVGYVILAELARKFGRTPPRERFHGDVVEADLAPPGGENSGDTRALLLSPTTFMNLSGTSVQEAMSFYKLANDELLVLCDDLNLPVGKLRFRAGGSAGGQKGLDDIIAKLGTEEFSRLRLGIGAAPEGWNWADYVLSKFRPDELPAIEQAVATAADAVAAWARKGIEYCMNQYN